MLLILVILGLVALMTTRPLLSTLLWSVFYGAAGVLITTNMVHWIWYLSTIGLPSSYKEKDE